MKNSAARQIIFENNNRPGLEDLRKVLKCESIHTVIRTKKFTKKNKPSNEITEDDLTFFLTTIRTTDGYPKIRDLQKLLRPTLNLAKINAILRYLEKSKRLEIDLDGNIIWIRDEHISSHDLSFSEVANISQDFRERFSSTT